MPKTDKPFTRTSKPHTKTHGHGLTGMGFEAFFDHNYPTFGGHVEVDRMFSVGMSNAEIGRLIHRDREIPRRWRPIWEAWKRDHPDTAV